ncbi:MAG: class II aldolase/adducin family protein [Verrucomicrobiota bacterium]
MSDSTLLDRALWLSHQLGEEKRGLAILGEGNTSARIDTQKFYVKASGSTLGNLQPKQLTVCDSKSLLNLLNVKKLTDQEIDAALLESRIDSKALKPSVEAVFHAYLLSLPDVHFVGHTHPIAVNQLLCSGNGKVFAEKRLFPDQIVCCGAKSALVPYTDPGLVLAQTMRKEVEKFINQTGLLPKTILIENHGFIALGKTEKEVLAATLMAEKSAKILVGALSVGKKGAVYLTPKQVERIAGRPDEHYRQKILNQSSL